VDVQSAATTSVSFFGISESSNCSCVNALFLKLVVSQKIYDIIDLFKIKAISTSNNLSCGTCGLQCEQKVREEPIPLHFPGNVQSINVIESVKNVPKIVAYT
jgi:ferredoxin-like protein FixX